MNILFSIDPCQNTKCGVNALCKVVLSTGRAFCACPYLMVGDPYIWCGKISKFNDLYHIISNLIFFMEDTLLMD